ncbi:MAG: hypothetical protein JXA66_04135 [Oligoflexia bacterium]|nr:hypothetical protein [Oligoflexia bacterium]
MKKYFLIVPAIFLFIISCKSDSSIEPAAKNSGLVVRMNDQVLAFGDSIDMGRIYVDGDYGNYIDKDIILENQSEYDIVFEGYSYINKTGPEKSAFQLWENINGLNGEEFILEVAPYVIKPNQYKKLYVRFKPAKTGINTVNVTISTNFGDFPLTITGTGVPLSSKREYFPSTDKYVNYDYHYDDNGNITSIEKTSTVIGINNEQLFFEYSDDNHLVKCTAKKDDSGTFKISHILKYDENGNDTVLEEYLISTGELNYKKVKTYDEYGKLIKFRNYVLTTELELFSTTTFTYNEHGTITELYSQNHKTPSSSNKLVLEYDEATGIKTKASYFEGSPLELVSYVTIGYDFSSQTNKYYTYLDALKHTTVDKFNDINFNKTSTKNYDCSDTLEETTLKTYDEKGKLLSEVHTEEVTPTSDYSYIYDYNDDLLYRKTKYNSEDDIDYWYEYSHDEYGDLSVSKFKNISVPNLKSTMTYTK